MRRNAQRIAAACMMAAVVGNGCSLRLFGPRHDPFYKAISEIYPKNRTALFIQGQNLARAGQYEEAADVFGDLAKMEPENARVWLMLGRMELETRNGIGAERAFRTAIARDSEGSEGHLGLANALILQGKIKEPEELAAQLMAKNGESATLLRLMGDICFVEDDPQGALEYYERSYQLNSDQRELGERISDLRLLLAGRAN